GGPPADFLQLDIDASQFGRRHETSLSILGDANTALQSLVELGDARPADCWYLATQENKEKWVNWLKSLEDREDEPIR
ncbi:pyruvate oxidase, partial [Enterococcus faecium]